MAADIEDTPCRSLNMPPKATKLMMKYFDGVSPEPEMAYGLRVVNACKIVPVFVVQLRFTWRARLYAPLSKPSHPRCPTVKMTKALMKL
jgi:hypothetical protein